MPFIICCWPTGICIVIYNASVLVSQCLQQSTVHTIEKEQGVKRSPTPSWLNFRHPSNAIFSNIASVALKAAAGDNWLKRNIHHETPCILLSSMKVNMCSPEGTMYDPYYIRLLGVYYVTRLRCIQHYYQQIEGV